MPWHHVIPRHEWKRRFGNLIGFDTQDNKVNLSHTNHTQLHQRMGEEGSNLDEIAGRAMSGQIGREEAIRSAQSAANRGNKHFLGRHHTPEEAQRMIERSRGNKYCLGKKNALGSVRTQKFKLGVSAYHKGRPKPQPQVSCPTCNTSGGANVMKRWHFDNCKGKK